ncbi:MAG TPA: DUF5995 family protein [Bryobacteraceae bacterium]
MPATSIDEVLSALTTIIDDARAHTSRVGYFAALYRRVTQSVKDDIAGGRFQNGALMERLDSTFANRYLDAVATFQAGRQPARSWAVAFEAASDPFPLILQQLLVGISAHINLDLGIATAEVAPGDQLPGIQTDFDRINGVLTALTGTVEREIGELSPAIHLLEELGLRTETRIINFDVETARGLAWNTAQRLAVTPANQLTAAIELLDFKVAAFGQLLIHPPAPIALKLAPIRIPESNDVRRIIDVLAAQ